MDDKIRKGLQECRPTCIDKYFWMVKEKTGRYDKTRLKEHEDKWYDDAVKVEEKYVEDGPMIYHNLRSIFELVQDLLDENLIKKDIKVS